MSDATAAIINKKEIGARIKKLRKESGLRQWQLAEMIGATQPAIHMYERGVLPEPRRLLDLARIGDTTVEWILTGRHWEGGSQEMRRAPEDVYRLAFQLKEFGDEERETLESALEIASNAAKTLRKPAMEPNDPTDASRAESPPGDDADRPMVGLAESLKVLESVRRTLMSQAAGRIGRARARGFREVGLDAADGAADEGMAPGAKKRAFRTSATGMEAIRGHIYRIDASLLVLGDILKDKELRAEFEEAVGRLNDKLESKKSRIVKMRETRKAK